MEIVLKRFDSDPSNCPNLVFKRRSSSTRAKSKREDSTGSSDMDDSDDTDTDH